MYVFEGIHNLASVVYDEENLTEELKAEGIPLETLPQSEVRNGKIAVLMADKGTKKVWYEYYDETPTLEDEFTELKIKQDLMQKAIDDLILGGVL